MCVLNPIYVLRSGEFNGDTFRTIPPPVYLEIQFEPEVLELQGYPSFSLVEFYDFTYIYVFEVEEFNGDTFKTLPPLVDLENPV